MIMVAWQHFLLQLSYKLFFLKNFSDRAAFQQESRNEGGGIFQKALNENIEEDEINNTSER